MSVVNHQECNIGRRYGDGDPIIYTSMKRKTTEQFIKEATVVHGDTYDYSLVEYINTDTRVKVICKKHGIFNQTPKAQLRGEGCPVCSGKVKNTIQLILEFKEIHNDTYDYSLVNYKSSKHKVKIICRTHGEFSQLPGDHRTGYGCPSCFIKRAKTTEQFIKEAINVHGSTYDYSLVKYKSAHTKIKIVCDEHGMFSQRPMDHLNENGCPDCARRGYIPAKGGTIYYIKFSDDNQDFYKIGITNGDVKKRIIRFGVNKSFSSVVLFAVKFDNGYIPQEIERNILQKYNEFKFVDAKQFMRNGFSETFNRDVLNIDKQNIDSLLETFRN